MIVVDVETTGLDPRKHAIVSIGAVEFERPANRFYQECRIDEGVTVDEYALRVNGFTPAMISDTDKPTLAELMKKFMAWRQAIADQTLGGHNIYFDISMLKAAISRSGLGRAVLGGVDLHNAAYLHMLQRRREPYINRYGFFSITADRVYEYVGLPPEPKPHHALTGALMEAEAFARLIYGQNLLPEFDQYPLPEYPEQAEPPPRLF